MAEVGPCVVRAKKVSHREIYTSDLGWTIRDGAKKAPAVNNRCFCGFLAPKKVQLFRCCLLTMGFSAISLHHLACLSLAKTECAPTTWLTYSASSQPPSCHGLKAKVS